MRISSIHIKRAMPQSFWHNSREISPEYVINDASQNECNRNAKDAYIRYYHLFRTAMKNYFHRINQMMQLQTEKTLWEAVIVLQAHHTMKDLIKLAKKINQKYGWQEIQISLHKDEGYIHKESGQKKINYHAHIVFFMVDSQGLYRFKRREFDAKKMSELQTFVAKELGMKRGQLKKISKRERLEHSQYRRMKEEHEFLVTELKRAKEELRAKDRKLSALELMIQKSKIEEPKNTKLIVPSILHPSPDDDTLNDTFGTKTRQSTFTYG